MSGCKHERVRLIQRSYTPGDIVAICRKDGCNWIIERKQAEAMLNEHPELKEENKNLRDEISSDNDELFDAIIEEEKLRDRIAQLEANDDPTQR